MREVPKPWQLSGIRERSYEFTLNLRHVHMLSEDDREWLITLGDSWTEAEQLALVVARHEGYVDNPGLRGLTGQHPADVTKVLELLDRGEAACYDTATTE